MRLKLSALFCILMLNPAGTLLFAQSIDIAKPAPEGVFLTLGKLIGNGSIISNYVIERKDNNGEWKSIAIAKAPLSYDEFNNRVKTMQKYLPALTLPREDYMRNLHERALSTGTTDSLKGIKNLAVRTALGVLFYDSTLQKGVEYTYRVSEIGSDGEVRSTSISNQVSIPGVFSCDSIKVKEIWHDSTVAMITWRSAGSNPAPYYTVYRFEEQKPYTAKGVYGKYVISDTTYYLFTDTSITALAGKELQYFLIPFDQYGNAGTASQHAIMPLDDFEKAKILDLKATDMKTQGGIRISWRIPNPIPFKSASIYKSSDPTKGFQLLKTVAVSDTFLIDANTLPDVTYHYYLRLESRNDYRIRKSHTISARGFFPVMPMPPVISVLSRRVNGPEFVITANDPRATHIRLYRSLDKVRGYIDISGPLALVDTSIVVFTDTSRMENGQRYFYAAGIDCSNKMVSELSTPVEFVYGMFSNLRDPSFIKSFEDKDGIKIFWEDVRVNSAFVAGYRIMRRELDPQKGTIILSALENSDKKPFEKAVLLDKNVVAGRKYTYIVHCIDHKSEFSRPGISVEVEYKKK